MRPGLLELVASSSLLFAHLQDRHGGYLLKVYRSVIVSTKGRLYGHVTAALDGMCFEKGSVTTVADDSMQGQEAHRYEYMIWPVCPGSAVPHECSTALPVQREGENDGAQTPVRVSGDAVRAVPVRVLPEQD